MKKINEVTNNVKRSSTESPIKERIYQELVKFGLTPECQYKVGPFYIDLAFPEIKLAIETDGKNYHWTEEQRQRDQYRQKRLEQQGWKFERFRGWVCCKYPHIAAAKIVTQYFTDKVTEINRNHARGLLAAFLANHEDDIEKAVKIIDETLAGK